MQELNVLSLAIGVLDSRFDWFAGRKLLEVKERDAIARLDLAVVVGVSKSERENTLLLQVGLVNTSKTLDDNRSATQVTWLQSRMFATRTFTVVLVTNSNPSQTFSNTISNSIEVVNIIVKY
jgi:hypothetical protein